MCFSFLFPIFNLRLKGTDRTSLLGEIGFSFPMMLHSAFNEAVSNTAVTSRDNMLLTHLKDVDCHY